MEQLICGSALYNLPLFQNHDLPAERVYRRYVVGEKLCNLLYLFSKDSPDGNPNHIDLTQDNIADILTINRVNAAKCISRLRDEGIIVSHRKWIEITDPEALERYCSQETLLS